jgi:hypothetical protein
VCMQVLLLDVGYGSVATMVSRAAQRVGAVPVVPPPGHHEASELWLD